MSLRKTTLRLSPTATAAITAQINNPKWRNKVDSGNVMQRIPCSLGSAGFTLGGWSRQDPSASTLGPSQPHNQCEQLLCSEWLIQLPSTRPCPRLQQPKAHHRVVSPLAPRSVLKATDRRRCEHLLVIFINLPSMLLPELLLCYAASSFACSLLTGWLVFSIGVACAIPWLVSRGPSRPFDFPFAFFSSSYSSSTIVAPGSLAVPMVLSFYLPTPHGERRETTPAAPQWFLYLPKQYHSLPGLLVRNCFGRCWCTYPSLYSYRPSAATYQSVYPRYYPICNCSIDEPVTPCCMQVALLRIIGVESRLSLGQIFHFDPYDYRDKQMLFKQWWMLPKQRLPS